MAHCLSHTTEEAIVAKAREIAERDGISFERAYLRAVHENPGLYAAHDAAWRRDTKPTPPNLAVPDNARAFFFHVLRELAQPVLADLRPVACRPAEEQPRLIETWARRNRLVFSEPVFDASKRDETTTRVVLRGPSRVPGWVTAQAKVTLDCWRRYPGLMREAELSWGERFGGSYKQEMLTVALAVGERDEPKKRKRVRMLEEERLLRKEAHRLKDRFFRYSYTEKHTPEHIEWLVRYAINGEAPEAIARSPRAVSLPAVKSAILTMAPILGIDYPPFLPKQRGRRKTNQT